MQHYKIAQQDNEIRDIFSKVLEKVHDFLGKGILAKNNNNQNISFEIKDEALGTCYISVYLKDYDPDILPIVEIEKYYENEIINESKNIKIQIKFTKDINSLVSDIIAKINLIKQANNNTFHKIASFKVVDSDFNRKNYPELIGEIYDDAPSYAQVLEIEEERPTEKHKIKVFFDDGDSLMTDINGTKEEIKHYYYDNKFVARDEVTLRNVTNVEFLD